MALGPCRPGGGMPPFGVTSTYLPFYLFYPHSLPLYFPFAYFTFDHIFTVFSRQNWNRKSLRFVAPASFEILFNPVMAMRSEVKVLGNVSWYG